MNSTLLRPGTIMTMDPRRRVLQEGALLVRGNRIERVLAKEDLMQIMPFEGEVVDGPDLVAIPGFVQAHLHLCQTLFRGLADDLELLDWLKLRIFPFEAAHDERSMYVSAMLGIAELLRSGTTCVLDMGSVHLEEQVIRAVEESGIRACLGKAMMDVNTLYPSLRESTRDALRTTRDLAERWHGAAGGRIRYAVAPRYVLSCTDTLLRDAYAMTQSHHGMVLHTHAAENRSEVAAVRQRCGMDNIEFFESIGILRENTCLAHCVWLNENEVTLLQQRNARVVHCPSSNAKLGSGVAKVPLLRERGITVSLGADGAPCNNSLDMFHEMRLAAMLQKSVHGAKAMHADDIVEMATLGGAAAVGMEREIGSLEEGKLADIVLLNLSKISNPLVPLDRETLSSAIVFTGSPQSVHAVMVDGRWLYRDGVYTSLDEGRLVPEARRELASLLDRVLL